MTARDKMMDAGWPDALIFGDGVVSTEYDDALIGVSHDGHAIYDYDLMIEGLVKTGMTEEEAADWISYNTIRSLDYLPADLREFAPIMMYRCNE